MFCQPLPFPVESTYNLPMKIYTKTGDSGQTSLLDGKRVEKYHPKIEAYGSVDELNCFIGCLRTEIQSNSIEIDQDLQSIQSLLFQIGSALAATKSEDIHKYLQASDAPIENLEKAMDEMSAQLPELKNFILPGGVRTASYSHICRSVARRAERKIVQLEDENLQWAVRFMNRLSDYFFVLARFLNHRAGIKDPIWKL